ncbi:MAG: FAD:protein FMN transferase, partial [Thermodesulfobacteriota bacterium]|nr:FAD:protein FMN transferase [Thermodesulfobacteriota bacterium]
MDKIALIEDGTVLVSSGPLHMTIKASEKGVPLTGLARLGADFALEILRQQAESLSVVKQRIVGLSVDRGYPEVVNLMISSCRRINDPLLTPLAAVAGAASDMVADYIANYNATKIVVDNGGDIAIRMKGDESVKVGLRLNVARSEFNYTLLVNRDCGICTSGFGGRSFTLGVADGV